MAQKQLTDCIWCGLNPCQCNPEAKSSKKELKSAPATITPAAPVVTNAATSAMWASIPVQAVEPIPSTVTMSASVAYTTSTDLDEIFVAAPPLTFDRPIEEEVDLDLRLAVENLLPLLHPEEREEAAELINPKQTSEIFRRGAEIRNRHGLA